MSMAVNLHDVEIQLAAAGLDLSGFDIGTSKPIRCRVDGERGCKGWYWLHELPFDSGDIVIVGSYGVWHGNDNGMQKIEVPKASKANKADNAEIRKRIMANKKKLAAELKRSQAKAAEEAVKYWRSMQVEGSSGYLIRKQVQAHGIRFKDGALAVPMQDVNGKIHGLQFILDRDNEQHKKRIQKMDGDKRFWPTGLAMQGHFHLIGAIDPTGVNLVTEGYATGSTMFEASGLPVAVVFTANNILPALLNLEKQYPRARFLIGADDDYLCRCQHCKKQTLAAEPSCSHCDKAPGKMNTGVTVAMKAAMTVDNAEWIKPEFTARDGRKLTDFNDLHCDETLGVVAAQLRDAVAAKFPKAGKAKPPSREAQPGGAGKEKLRIISVDESVDRFPLVFGVKDAMFDRALFKIVPKSCVLDITSGRAWDEMKRHPDFKIVDIDSVGFDPTESDQNIECNMWGGWPTKPDNRGSCDKLLELLAYMCSEELQSRDVYKWLIRWLAYPIQHPGAKMKTAVVVHGGQGVGKNMFFEAVMAIYGEYGRVVGQSELEEKFNEWASRKLFLIANEVMARAELFHQKNKIKALITDDWIHINPKNVASHDERNHLNLVFLSNEAQPVVLDPDDRRFMAIWTPKKRDPEFYKSVLDEIANGGIEALHDHLLNVDLGDFNPGTPPIETRARTALIEISKESPDRFIESWLRDELDVGLSACALGDLYKLYERWIRTEGERFAYAKNKFSARINMRDDLAVAKKAVLQSSGKIKVVCAVLPDDDEKPDEALWKKWLGEKVIAFNKLVMD